ncbi:MAG: response regulator [Bryobacterales bacterium]|nr:response regulator [Bryobacterales bacterium]
MQFLRSLAALLVALTPLVVFPLSGQRYSFEHYGLSSGLTNLSVRDLAQDRAGLLWVATGNGVYRFDGHRFVRFGVDKGLADDSTHGVLGAPDGTVYAGTSGGVSANWGGGFQELLISGSGESVPCIGAGCMALSPDGRLLVASPAGLARLENGSFRIFPGTEKWGLRSVLALPSGDVWVTSLKSVYRGRIKPNGNMSWDNNAERRWLPEGEYSAPVLDGGKRLWIRSRNGLFLLEPGAGRFQKSDLEFPSVGRLAGISVDAKGRIWVPTFDGLWHRNEAGGQARWVRYSSAQGLRADPVSAVMWDRHGTPWIGLEAHGLARWNGYPGWRGWEMADGLSNNGVMSFARDGVGRFWIGTKSGLNRMDEDGRFHVLTARDGMAADDVRALVATPDGAIWAGSNEGGLTRVGADGVLTRFGSGDGLGSTRIVSITVERDGELWLCTRAGLYRGDWRERHPRFQLHETPLTREPRGVYKVMRGRDGSFWVASSFGLARQRNGQWRQYSTADGLKRDGIVFLTERVAGEIWIGYTGVNGISRLELNGDGSVRSAVHFGRGTGLLSDNISFVDVDSRGEMWVGTDVGASVFASGQWQHLDPSDGMIWHDVMLGGFFAHPNGRIYIGTSSGFSEWTPDSGAVAAPQAVITSVSSGGVEIPMSKWPDLSLGSRNLHIEFSNLRLLDKMAYRYRFLAKDTGENPDAGWVSTEHPVVDLALQPGHQRFEVQASRGGRPFGGETASLAFYVEPYWPESRWFRGALLGSAALLAWLAWRRRLSSLEAQRTALETAVDDRTRELREQSTRIEHQKSEIESLLQAAHNANRLKGEFLANMSHEIRTPMNGVIGMTSLALATELSSEQRDYIETARTSAQSLLQILNDILDFSKIEAGRLDVECVPFSLRRTIQDTARPFLPAIRAKNLTFNISIEPTLPDDLRGDPLRLRQILNNVIGNALKFTERGSIGLCLSLGEDHTDERPVIHFSLSDTGIGISAGQLEVIFEQFRQADGSTTRKYGGTGLGLSICVRLAQLMGGRMWAESIPGEGTTIHFELAFSCAAGGQRDTPVVEVEAGRSLKVLLVEDNAISQRLAQRLLEKQGHSVTVASNGAQGVSAFRDGEFDLVLMDVQMPELDGLSATRFIRELEEGRRTPIVMLTANAMKGDKERCLDAGADGYLTKPLEFGELIRTIKEMTASQPTA